MPCAAWALVRLFGLEAGYPAVALMAYTLFVLPVAVLASAIGLVLRQWAAAVVAGLAAAALIAVIAPRAVGGPDDVSGRQLRVMSANVLHGSADPHEVLRLAKDHHVDVLALQELTPEFARNFRLAGARESLPYAALSLHEGVSGSGIYARLPVMQIATPSVASTRAIASISPNRQLDLTSVHNVPLPSSNAGTSQWADHLDGLPGTQPAGPIHFLIGDFNATFDQSEFRDVVDRGYADAAERMGDGLAPTFPAVDTSWRLMPVTIDHVLYDRDRVGVHDFQVMTLPGSDHRAIYAELVLRR